MNYLYAYVNFVEMIDWAVSFIKYLQLVYIHSGGLSNFLYYVSLPDDIDSCNSVKNTKRARKDASLQEPKEVRSNLYISSSFFACFNSKCKSQTKSIKKNAITNI